MTFVCSRLSTKGSRSSPGRTSLSRLPVVRTTASLLPLAPSVSLDSCRHTFASLGRMAGEAACNVAAAMGHSRSHLVDQVYAPSLHPAWQAWLSA